MDNVKEALAAMYSPTVSQDQKKAATQFLERFQKSSEAWEASHTLLADESNPLEYRMFASQTLRSKATYDLSQLPKGSLSQLRDSLLGFLTLYAPKNKPIRTQLSLALCQLALQDLEWHNALNDISSRLNTEDNIPALLEFLKSIPEELTESNKTPLTDEEFNQQVNELITKNVQHVLQLLKNLIDQGSPHRVLILDCLNSWIKECPIEDVLRIHSLATLVFESLMHDETFEKASECICSILRETRDIDNYELIDALYQQILTAHGLFSERPEKLEDPEIFHGLAKIFVEAGESWHVLIAKNPAHFYPLVQILLSCCKYEDDLDVVKYTFYFWYQLKQMLTLPKFEESRAIFSPIYLELILVIIKHLRYPLRDDIDDLFDGDKEQEDKFKEFRYEMGDVLKDCCAVVGSQKALNVPFEQIKASIGENVQWQYLEAPLFSMRVMAKEVPLKENKILPAIMNMLVQLPEHPKIRYATTLVLGRYSEWTSKNPQFLEPQLNYIIKGFDKAQEAQRDIVSATSQALMYFCQDCASLLVNYIDQLFMLYSQVQNVLEVSATYDLVNGLSHVINEMPLEEQFAASETFLSPTLHKINNICATSQSRLDETNVNAMFDEAEIFSIFLKICRCRDYNASSYPIADVFQQTIWPMIKEVFVQFGKSLKVSEVLCKVIKNAINGCTSFLTPILPEVSQLLHDGFQNTFFGCFLWVTGVIVQCTEDFSPDVNAQIIYPLAISQSATVLQMFGNDSGIDIRNIPDVIEDYFNMSSDLLMFFPTEVVINQDFMNSVFETGVKALRISEEYNPLMACVHFFIDYISWGSENPPVSFFEGDYERIKKAVKNFLSQNSHTGQLIEVVIYGLIHKFYNDVDGNDLLIKILNVFPNQEQVVLWLQQAVSALPNVSEREVSKLIGTVTTSLPNKDNRRIRMAIKDFVSWYTRKNVNARASFE